jgi:hypothetical protein
MLSTFAQYTGDPRTQHDTPSVTTVKLSKLNCAVTDEERAAMADKPYRSVVGALSYVALSTRPDIANAVNQLARYQESPGRTHWSAAMRVLHYLNATRDVGLVFGPNGSNTSTAVGSDSVVTAFCDADWAGDVDDRKSTTGFVIKVFGNTISWSSRKQSNHARSSGEAEFYAISDTVCELLWTSQLVSELLMQTTHTTESGLTVPITLSTDNRAAISIGKNHASHGDAKHIALRHHFVRQHIATGELIVNWISTKLQQADVLTKALPKDSFVKCRNAIMIAGGTISNDKQQKVLTATVKEVC